MDFWQHTYPKNFLFQKYKVMHMVVKITMLIVQSVCDYSNWLHKGVMRLKNYNNEKLKTKSLFWLPICLFKTSYAGKPLYGMSSKNCPQIREVATWKHPHVSISCCGKQMKKKIIKDYKLQVVETTFRLICRTVNNQFLPTKHIKSPLTWIE